MLDYITPAEAVDRKGLRLVFGLELPGPWSNAAKAIYDLKQIPYTPVGQVRGAKDPVLRQWTGQESAPVAMYNDERPRARWDEMLLLAERLAPEPRLIPADPGLRTEMFGLAHEIVGEEGLGWAIRNFRFEEQRHLTPEDRQSLRPNVLKGIGNLHFRYFDHSKGAAPNLERAIDILKIISSRYRENRKKGNRFLIGDSLTAADIYWTAFSIYFSPFQEHKCPIPDFYRAFCNQHGELVRDALDPILIDHREMILDRYFKLPIMF